MYANDKLFCKFLQFKWFNSLKLQPKMFFSFWTKSDRRFVPLLLHDINTHKGEDEVSTNSQQKHDLNDFVF